MDLTYAKGHFPVKNAMPNVLGSEASGLVVESGGGIFARGLVNRNVHCFTRSLGSWAEYMVADAANCTVIPKNSDLDRYAYLTSSGTC